MANTLTAIMPTIFTALNIASRELIGFIPAVSRNATLERAAVGQTVTMPSIPAATGGNITPGSVPPDDGDVIVGADTMAITKSKYSPVRWNGEEQLAIGPNGEQYNAILARQFVEAMRWLANQVEYDLWVTAYKNASRAYGTAGTAPFGVAGDLTDFAGVNRILDENGAPQAGRRLIIGSAARFNMEGKQSVLFKANESGGDRFLRERVVGDVMNFGIGVSSAVGVHTKGTGTLYDINVPSTGEILGQTTLTLDGGTPGATGVLAGDVVTFAGDTNMYVNRLALAGAAGDIKIGEPGLRIAAADATEMTIGNSYTPNIAFTPDALALAARAPAAPTGGDSADDATIVQDTVSGLPFEVRLYREYRRIRYEVGLAWGTAAQNTRHIATLMG